MSQCMVFVNGQCVVNRDGSVPNPAPPGFQISSNTTPLEHGMSGIMLALILIGLVAVYVFVGGLAGSVTIARLRRNRGYDNMWDGERRFAISVLWPLLVPFLAGAMAGHWLTQGEERKVEKARQAKLAYEREASLKRLEIEANESALKVLEANGIHARVEM